MSCLECGKASECHKEVLNDLQMIECIQFALERNYIAQAKDELVIYHRRLKARNDSITGR